MWVFNKWLEQTGTIIYENNARPVSGLIGYDVPYNIQTGTRFAVLSRQQYVRKSDETHHNIVDEMVVHFGWGELQKLHNTGIEVEVGSTRVQYDGVEYRATKVNDFGQKYNRTYIPMGVVEVNLERRTPVAN